MGFRLAVHGSTVSILRQVALSVAATLIATAILTGAQRELEVSRSRATAPVLTSGGKFAARIEALAIDDETADAVLLPATLASPPLSTLSQPGIALSADGANRIPPPPVRMADVEKAPTHAIRPETRHRMGADAGVSVLPPRRADFVAEAIGPGSLQAAAGEPGSSSFWSAAMTVLSTPKDIVRRAVSLGGDLFGREARDLMR